MIKSPFEFFFLSLLSLPSGGIKGEAFLSFFFSFFLLSSFSPAQQLQSLQRGLNRYPRTIFADTIADLLYVGGDFSKTGLYADTDGIWVRGMAQWNGIKWDSLGCGVDRWDCSIPQSPNEFPNGVRGIIKYNGEIYAGGAFRYAGEIPVTGIAKWNGANWDTVTKVIAIDDFGNSVQGAINGFLLYNNELYAFGLFDSIGGIAADMIAKYDGQQWYNFPDIVTDYGWQISTATFYKDKLYVGGNFSGSSNIKDIARFNFTTNQWESVGGGATCDCWVNKFYIYHDTLIVAGYFQSLGGMPFNNIAGWDGNNWIDLNGGLMPSNVWDVIEYDNYLYAGGQISYLPDNTPIKRMAKWDGQQWTDAGLDFRSYSGSDGTPSCMAVLNNELYIGGSFITVNGDTMNSIMKYNASVGINEPISKKNIVSVYPNPARDRIFIEGNFSLPAQIELYDVTGKRVFRQRLLSINQPLSISLSPGLYLYRLTTSEGKIQSGKIEIE